ncbi:MAG TPA: trypsin-like peptidase domain-containing protein [Candidatus Limnocylindrales bacterium]|nr:trypsin-like peptidase domain-containing protein [Candidatus Limnocylindrales bacterium]
MNEPFPPQTPSGPARPSDAPVWTTAASTDPPAVPPNPFSAPVPTAAPATAAAPKAKRTVGPMFVVGAVLAASLLASGGTFALVSATSHAPTATSSTATAQQTTTQNTSNGGATGSTATGSQAPVVDIVKAVSPAVVTIVADGVTATDPTTGQTGSGTATGSGVIFDPNGLILTNHHVVAGDPQKLTVHLNDGRTFDARVYGIDTLTDLAIVKVDATGLPTAPIGDSSNIQVGQQAIAIGSPLGTFTDSVTSGIVSALGRSIPVEDGSILSNLIQTDTAINPGNSGGPLLDPSGKVIGINTAAASQAQNIGFAIPIDIAKPLLAQATSGKPLARPYLGIRFETIDPTVQSENQLPVDKGAWIPSATAVDQSNGQGNGGVQDPNNQDPFGLGGQDPFVQGRQLPAESSVVAGGPAAQGGVQPGDIVTAVDGTALDATHPLDLVMSQYAPGTSVKLDILRNGQTTQATVVLGTRPATQ